MLDFDLFTPRRRRSGPVARPHRLLQLRRGVPPQARGGDVRVHQVALPARLPLHQHQRAGVHRGRGPGGWCTRASTRSRSRSTAPPPDSYAKYRRRGNFDKAIGNLRAVADEKRRAGRDVPFINWRYILFSHNDSDEEMALARTMAAEMGVDRLCWELTDHPEDMFSRRFAAGSAGARRASATRSGTTTIWATPSRAPRRGREIDVKGRCPACRRSPRPGRTVDVDHHASPTARPARSPRRPATAAASCASARSCAGRTARWSTATSHAPGCRQRSPPGASVAGPDHDHRTHASRGAIC